MFLTFLVFEAKKVPNVSLLLMVKIKFKNINMKDSIKKDKAFWACFFSIFWSLALQVPGMVEGQNCKLKSGILKNDIITL